MYPPAQAWFKNNTHKENWFLHVNFWDPHTPYDHPKAYGNPFKDEPIGGWLIQNVIDAQNASFGPHSATEVYSYSDVLPDIWRMGVGHVQNLEDAKAHIDGYDTGIHYADHYIGKLVQDLEDLGVYEDTAIIVSADHGENHGELNVWGDHQTADQCTNRLPLIVRWPGVMDTQAGGVKAGLYYHLYLTATLAEFVSAEQPANWDGSSFAADLPSAEDRGCDFLVLGQGAWSCQRSVRWEDWLAIRTYHTGLKDLPAYMLFDLKNDPHETTNLAASRGDVLQQGLQNMDAWLAEQTPRALRGDPFWTVIAEGGPLYANENTQVWRDYLERLRRTGRAHHADKLAAFGGRPTRTGLD